ncbi:MAG TPA: hypothetical protein VG937_19440 [Polyangiaceae bacterium]|nr:hypothetical protein [Polyangiaceae bacterium]
MPQYERQDCSTRIALFFSALACIAGCSEAATTGKRVTLRTAMAKSAEVGTFTTGFGWDVTLTQAAIATNGFYYFDGPPPTASFKAKKRGFRQRVADWMLGSAWAHPGHYQAGDALGQTLLPEAVALDLFSDPLTPLPDGVGVTGTYRSAQFVIPSEPPADAVLAGHIAIAQGTAVEHGSSEGAPTYHFRMVADYADIEMNVNGGAVDGCVLDETAVVADGKISVEIKPAIWLNLVDFSKLDPGNEDDPTEARDAGFSQGVTQLSAYHFAYSEVPNAK